MHQSETCGSGGRRSFIVRRVARHFYLVAASASMLLCIAMTWRSVRSYRGPEHVIWQTRGGRLFNVISGHGTVDFLTIPRWPQVERFSPGKQRCATGSVRI